METSGEHLSIIIPAFNEAETIQGVIRQLKTAFPVSEIIVVDDASSDATSEEARKGGADLVLRHKRNRGYGSSIKDGARRATGSYIATYDADGQHDPASLKILWDEAVDREMVVGARSARNQNPGRLVGKILLFRVANMLAGEKIKDLNSGLRIIRKDVFEEYALLLPDGFSLSTTITLAMLKDNRDVHFIPVEVKPRAGGKSTVRFLRDGYMTMILILRIIMLFDPLKVLLPVSLLLGFIGAVYGITWVVLNRNIPDGAILFMLSGVMSFLFGLLADQIANIRRQMKK